MKTLIERVKEDIRKNPEKRNAYIALLADMGLITKGAIKVTSIDAKALNSLNDNVVVIIKGA